MVTKTVYRKTDKPCLRCKGSGLKAGGFCYRCDGSGVETKAYQVPVDDETAARNAALRAHWETQDAEFFARREARLAKREAE
jgi:DnaJ-class molecular chaperone